MWWSHFISVETLTTDVGNCGGGWLRELKTVNHDGVWYGSVAPLYFPLGQGINERSRYF